MSNKNIIKAAVSGIASMIPGINGINEFFNTYFQEQSNDRHNEVEKEFNKKFKDMQDKIDNNPSNFAVFINTVKGAMEDISNEKIKNYVNATMHAINNENLNNTKIHIFLNLLRKYSMLHIKTLQYFNTIHSGKQIGVQTNVGKMQSTEECIADIIEKEQPDLVKDIPLLSIVINELYTDGLINISKLEQLHNSFSRSIAKQTTSLGEEFLNFIN